MEAQIIAFADPLKDFLTMLVGRREPFRGNDYERSCPLPELTFGDLSPHLYAAILESWPGTKLEDHPTGRQLMQLFGTEVIRERFCADSWIRMANGRATLFDGVTIIDDVRFPNEARKVGDGGILNLLFKAVRPGMPHIAHPSESAVDTVPLEWCDEVFTNNVGVDDLSHKVLAYLNTYPIC
jgi:hypothetical protein